MPKFKVGEIYKAETPLVESWKGAIIKITGVYEDRVWIKPVRGEAPDYFMPHSQYGQRLTLLTGSQIGEAVKAFDAKKTGGVKEVKRPAKLGEFIKALRVDCADTGRFRVGAILKVTSVPDEGVWKGKAVCYNNTSCVIKHDQYVVLEGYSPAPQVKEVKRHAHVGEYIKLTAPDSVTVRRYGIGEVQLVTKEHSKGSVFVNGDDSGCILDCEYVVLEGYQPDKSESPAEPKEEKRKAKVGDTIMVLKNNGGPVTKGTVWEVTRINSWGLEVKNEKHSRNYAVRHNNYVVISSGKHRYTDSQVAEAKRIVLDIIREYAEKSEYILFDSIGKTFDNYRGYLVPKGSETDFDYGELTISEVKAGESKCGPNDEPNEWIGKCVAICKLLGKPIPHFIMENGTDKRFDFEKAQRLCDDGSFVTIRCKDKAEGDALKAELEKLSVCWRSGDKPTEKDYFTDGCFVVENGKTLSYGQMGGHDNFVDFSDCFTEI